MRSSVLRKPDYQVRPTPRNSGRRFPLRLLVSRPAASKPNIAALAERFAPEPQNEGNDDAKLPGPEAAPPVAQGQSVKGLIAALVCVALVPTALLFVLLWQGTMRPHAVGAMPPAGGLTAAATPNATAIGAARARLKRAGDCPLLGGQDRGHVRRGDRLSHRHRYDR